MQKLQASDFAPDFAWGVATAAYQVEGAVNEGGRGPSIWDTFTHTPGKTFEGQTGDVSVDHYHRYREDVALMADIGVNAYRFSIAWARLMPEGEGEVNPDGVEFYRSLCKELLSRGIRPSATLYHWDLPQALQDRGGWSNPDSVDWFANYAVLAKEALGDLVQMWSTLNEPWCASFLGHSAGEHAPGVTDPGEAYVVAHHLMLAHHAAVKRMRQVNVQPEDQIGIVLNLIPARPARDTPEAAEVAAAAHDIQNNLYFEAVFDGRYPERVLGYMDKFGVADRIDLDSLAGSVEPIDFLGINYYNINFFDHQEGAPIMHAWPGPENAVGVTPQGPLTEMNWAVNPEGLTWMLEDVAGRQPGLPLYIMENGAAYPDPVPDNGRVADPLRTEYVQKHLTAIKEAIDAGVEVKGYYLWSFLDNFEWARGYAKRFGIVYVNYETLERTVKDSGYWYREFLRT